MTKTFWLSFCDDATGKFLGVTVVDVTSADVAELLADGFRAKFPRAQPGAEWIAAATRVAWAHGVNPGGQVGSSDVTGDPLITTHAPRFKLMDRVELAARGLIDATVH
jgi:hypothetical protein